MRRPIFVLLLLVTGCGGGTSGPPVPEAPRTVHVVDGDTVDIDDVRYRLHGVDAPESYQTCRAWGLTWECGQAATAALEARAAEMSCSGSGTDAYGRTVAVCSSGGEDLNAWMVANGWALAEYSTDYVTDEAEARAAKRGIHRGQFVNPAARRRGQRLEGEDTFSSTATGYTDVEQLAHDLLWGTPVAFDGVTLEHSAFGLTPDGAVSFGDWRKTAPTGVGRVEWRGEAVATQNGIDTASRGTAVVDIDDLAAPDVDVVLSGLPREFTWTDVPVDGEGLFDAPDGSMWGGFFGPQYEEVGGVLERDGWTGAFGGVLMFHVSRMR